MYRPVYSAQRSTSSTSAESALQDTLRAFLMAFTSFATSSSRTVFRSFWQQRFNYSLLMSMPTNKFFITCIAFCGQWTADPSPTNLIRAKAIFLFRSWINGPGGAKKIHGSYPFAMIENRSASLSFVKLLLIAQIYYFCITNFGAVNLSANLRFAFKDIGYGYIQTKNSRFCPCEKTRR